MTVPLDFLAIPQTLGVHVNRVSATTTLTLPIQKPVTRTRDDASSACTTRKGTIASSASMGTTAMLFGKTVEVRRSQPQTPPHGGSHPTPTPSPSYQDFVVGVLISQGEALVQ